MKKFGAIEAVLTALVVIGIAGNVYVYGFYNKDGADSGQGISVRQTPETQQTSPDTQPTLPANTPAPPPDDTPPPPADDTPPPPPAQSMVVVDADLEGIWVNGSGDVIYLFEDIEIIGFSIEPDRDGGGGEVLVDLDGNNYWDWWADWWISPDGILCTDDYEWSLYNEFTCIIVGDTLTLIDADGDTRTYTRG